MGDFTVMHQAGPLFAALYLPRFFLQVVLRHHQERRRGARIAVLDSDLASQVGHEELKGRLLQVTEAAEQCGVYAGMNPSQALARCRNLLLLHRDLDGEQEAQRELHGCAIQWTPHVEVNAPGVALLDFSRVKGIAQQPEKSGHRLHEQLQDKGWIAQVGFAANPDMAFLVAQAAQPVRVLTAGADTVSFIHELPLSALRPSAVLAERLDLWGIRLLGAFVKLAREDIASRLGEEGVRLWDLAAGGRERLLDWVRPVTHYREVVELDYPVESLEPLLFILRRMLEAQCLRLAENWLVASALFLELGFDDKSMRHCELRTAEPVRDADLLLRLIHTHLDGFTAAAPIVKVGVELTPARPVASQDYLFERRLKDPNRFAETLAQLEALLGRGRVGRARLLPSRRMDAFEVLPFTELTKRSVIAMPAKASTAELPGLPLRRFRPSREVSVQVEDGRPVFLQMGEQKLPLENASGPWNFSGEWWDVAAWQREVWEVATGDGCLYQIAKEESRWVLDGVFG